MIMGRILTTWVTIITGIIFVASCTDLYFAPTSYFATTRGLKSVRPGCNCQIQAQHHTCGSGLMRAESSCTAPFFKGLQILVWLIQPRSRVMKRIQLITSRWWIPVWWADLSSVSFLSGEMEHKTLCKIMFKQSTFDEKLAFDGKKLLLCYYYSVKLEEETVFNCIVEMFLHFYLREMAI